MAAMCCCAAALYLPLNTPQNRCTKKCMMVTLQTTLIFLVSVFLDPVPALQTCICSSLPGLG